MKEVGHLFETQLYNTLLSNNKAPQNKIHGAYKLIELKIYFFELKFTFAILANLWINSF
jgi:hypothetical protein